MARARHEAEKAKQVKTIVRPARVVLEMNPDEANKLFATLRKVGGDAGTQDLYYALETSVDCDKALRDFDVQGSLHVFRRDSQRQHRSALGGSFGEQSEFGPGGQTFGSRRVR